MTISVSGCLSTPVRAIRNGNTDVVSVQKVRELGVLEKRGGVIALNKHCAVTEDCDRLGVRKTRAVVDPVKFERVVVDRQTPPVGNRPVGRGQDTGIEPVLEKRLREIGEPQRSAFGKPERGDRTFRYISFIDQPRHACIATAKPVSKDSLGETGVERRRGVQHAIFIVRRIEAERCRRAGAAVVEDRAIAAAVDSVQVRRG